MDALVEVRVTSLKCCIDVGQLDLVVLVEVVVLILIENDVANL